MWKPVLKEADLNPMLRIHDLRYAHASWLLSEGADFRAVKEHLAHGSISTTERYLNTLDDNTALTAFDKIHSSRPDCEPPD
ncbi:tyrosine-type recombinase/integrase [Spirillospora sp. NPDC046719]